MEHLANIAAITFIVVFVVDFSGIMENFKRAISILRGRPINRLRPIDCSMCMTFWSCLAYIIAARFFSLGGVALVCAFAALSSTVHSILRLIIDIMAKIIQQLYKLFDL